jgi:hypothetical protein
LKEVKDGKGRDEEEEEEGTVASGKLRRKLS